MLATARRFRFSLLSLILFVAACGSGYALWAHWAPWKRVSILTRSQSRWEPMPPELKGVIMQGGTPMEKMEVEIFRGPGGTAEYRWPLEEVVYKPHASQAVVCTHGNYKHKVAQRKIRLNSKGQIVVLTQSHRGDEAILDFRKVGSRWWGELWITDLPNDQHRLLLDPEIGSMVALYSEDDNHIVVLTQIETAHMFSRQHPNAWHGIFHLPECWLTFALSLALLCSLRRDWKGLARGGQLDFESHTDKGNS